MLGRQTAFETVSGIVVGSGGLQVVMYDAFGTVVRGGEQDVGGSDDEFHKVSAVRTVVGNGGIQRVSPESFAIDTTVKSGGKIISEEGFIVGGVIKSGGRAMLTGGTVSGTIVSSGGVLSLLAVTDATNTTLRGGTEIVSGGGGAGDIRFSGGGELTLAGSATASATLSGFYGKARLDLSSYHFGAGPKLSFTENAGKTQGTLTVSDGALTATLTLFGNYVAAGLPPRQRRRRRNGGDIFGRRSRRASRSRRRPRLD